MHQSGCTACCLKRSQQRYIVHDTHQKSSSVAASVVLGGVSAGRGRLCKKPPSLLGSFPHFLPTQEMGPPEARFSIGCSCCDGKTKNNNRLRCISSGSQNRYAALAFLGRHLCGGLKRLNLPPSGHPLLTKEGLCSKPGSSDETFLQRRSFDTLNREKVVPFSRLLF